jgi:hypothetical protein
LKVCVRDMLLCLVGALIYYVIVRIFFYDPEKIIAPGYQVVFSLRHVWIRSVSFVTHAIPAIFNYWNIYYSYFWGAVAAILMGLTMLICCFIDRKRGSIQRMLMILGIFLIVNMIWFVGTQGFIPRAFFVSGVMCLLLSYGVVIWVGKKMGVCFEKLALFLSVALLAIGVVSANVTVIRNVWNVNAEMLFIRSRLVPYLNSSTTEIRLIRPKDNMRGYHGFKVTPDQFNAPTAGYQYDPPYLLRSVLKDVYNPNEMHCGLSVLEYGQPAPAPDSRTVVVDMNDLVAIADWSVGQKHSDGKR